VAEDDNDIGFMYLNLLQNLGHHVTLTNDGEKCLLAYIDKLKLLIKSKGQPDSDKPFDTVILDHKMPKKDGFEVAKQIISINPHQRVIIASGYSKDIFDEASKHFNIPLEVLQKPFSRMTLVKMLQ
jgi:CheY-like chemotaxis protein